MYALHMDMNESREIQCVDFFYVWCVDRQKLFNRQDSFAYEIRVSIDQNIFLLVSQIHNKNTRKRSINVLNTKQFEYYSLK